MRNIFLAGLVFMISSPIFGASLEELVGYGRAAVLRSPPEAGAPAEPITEVQQKTSDPRLLPRHTDIERFVEDNRISLDPNLFVETLSLYHKPHSAAWSEAEQIGLLNQLSALSTLTGTQYYSESRKIMRTFYEYSHVIDNPADKNPLPDPDFGALPDSFELYARQRDLTFGDNIYCFSYRTGSDYIAFVQENMTSMNAGIISAVGKNKFRSMIAIIDSGDSLLVYAAAMAKTATIPGMGARIGISFTNRAKAMLKWFSGRADGVFR